MKIIIALILSLATVTAAYATLGLGNRFGRMGNASSKHGTGVTPSCSNKLDFSQSCNSQYIVIGPMR